VKKQLEAVYGKPSSENATWKDPQYKSDPEKMGLAVSLGHLVFFKYMGKTQTTSIQESLNNRGPNNTILLMVNYYENVEK